MDTDVEWPQENAETTKREDSFRLQAFLGQMKGTAFPWLSSSVFFAVCRGSIAFLGFENHFPIHLDCVGRRYL